MKLFLTIALVSTLQLKGHVPRVISVKMTDKGPVVIANSKSFGVSVKAGKITVISN